MGAVGRAQQGGSRRGALLAVAMAWDGFDNHHGQMHINAMCAVITSPQLMTGFLLSLRQGPAAPRALRKGQSG
eukprot:3205277-Pleurochrysis_carterae.AAC.2